MELAAADISSEYCIVSATCTDGIGLHFELDPGIRVPQLTGNLSRFGGTLTYTPDVMWCKREQYWRMYFSAWAEEPGSDRGGVRGYIMAATSTDGLAWELSNGGQPVNRKRRKNFSHE